MSNQKRIFNIGQLVSHQLYPMTWLAIVLKSSYESAGLMEGNCKSWVKIIPGTKCTNFFKNDSGCGWVYNKWLWVPGGMEDEIQKLKAYYFSKQRNS